MRGYKLISASEKEQWAEGSRQEDYEKKQLHLCLHPLECSMLWTRPEQEPFLIEVSCNLPSHAKDFVYYAPALYVSRHITGKEYSELMTGSIYTEFNQCTTYFRNGLRHREDDLPAVIFKDGTRMWFQNGKLHRSEQQGPAVHYANGTKEYHWEDKLHRRQGPAILYPEGFGAWYVDGILLGGDFHANDFI